jgi:hypothetical protein
MFPDPAKHCSIRCWRGKTFYTTRTDCHLNRVNGLACVSDGNDPYDPNAPVVRVQYGHNLCDCVAAACQANLGCNRRYKFDNCNSNWFAASVEQCCTGARHSRPEGAQYWHSCCTQIGTFNCPNGYAGHGQTYSCPKFEDCTTCLEQLVTI